MVKCGEEKKMGAFDWILVGVLIGGLITNTLYLIDDIKKNRRNKDDICRRL